MIDGAPGTGDRQTDGGNRPTPTITVFHPRFGVLKFFLIFGIAIMLQAIVTAGFFMVFLNEQIEFLIAGLGLSIFLLLVGYWFAAYAWRRMRDPENPIIVGPSGLHDRATSERPIAWSDIRDLSVWDGVRGGPVIVYDLADGAADRAGIYARVRRTMWLNRLFGYSYLVRSYGTDATIGTLIEAIVPFAEVKRHH